MTDETDNPEVFIRDGEAWIPDGNALCARIGAAYLYFYEGDLWAGTPGSGDEMVRDLLTATDSPTPRKTATLTTIK